ncbi:filamentous hemagglutinin N-terminal domain-containing protein, partial [Noviherbaspirillum sp.]|uniref:filamentous hemagglutinin N-terminal domain-containing protein n=1 Tax=Noviherbaspirillum sp. TaxID=1926288 RepID=UPI002D6ECEC8
MFIATTSQRPLLQRLIAGGLIVLQVLTPALFAGTARAQVRPNAVNPDRSAQGQRPVVNVAANGVPVVQISPPSAAGVSNNRFTDYNVGEKGLILNNTGSNSQTHLAGWIAGNPMLGNGSARTILNQVTGSTPTSMAGYTEVGGNKANVIIANPNGITCAGCGFINTPRVTLSTGTPEIGADGSVRGFSVRRGQITIDGTGFEARSVDQVDLIAHSLRINAELWAKRLELRTGGAQVDYDGGGVTANPTSTGAETVALDVSQLGGMYANSIRLIGTERGVGVNSAGVIDALTGNLEMTEAGDVRIVGGSMRSKGDLSIYGEAGISNAGTIHADGRGAIYASGTLSNSGVMIAGQGLRMQGGSVDNTGSIAAGAGADGKIRSSHDLALIFDGDVRNRGELLAGRNLTLSGKNGSLAEGNITSVTNLQGKVSSKGNTAVDTDTLDNNTGIVSAEGDLLVQASGAVQNHEGVLQANRHLALTAASLANGKRDALASGKIVTADSGTMAVALLGSLDNAQGVIAGGSNVSLSAASVDNTGGQLSASGSMDVAVSAALANALGRIEGEQITVSAGSINNRSAPSTTCS